MMYLILDDRIYPVGQNLILQSGMAVLEEPNIAWQDLSG